MLLVAGEAFGWKPWEAAEEGGMGSLRLVNAKGQFEVDDDAWGVLGLVWPKPGKYFGINPTTSHERSAGFEY